MGIKFVDRKSTYPGRYKATKTNGTSEYLTLERADEPTTEGTPLNAATLNRLVQGHTPRNLLDNSDFTNPVNQRGKTAYSETGGYTIDRWKTASKLTLAVQDASVKLTCTSTSSANGVTQYLENPPAVGTVVTLAMMETNGTLSVGSITMPSSSYTVAFRTASGVIGRMYADRVSIMVPIGVSIDVKWVALYEGEYSAENLPEYQPKGYAAELAECQRYYWKIGAITAMGYTYSATTAYVVFISPVIMRTKPEIVCSDDVTFTIRCGGNEYSVSGSSLGTNQYMVDQYHRFSVVISGLGLAADENINVIKGSGTLEFVADINP